MSASVTRSIARSMLKGEPFALELHHKRQREKRAREALAARRAVARSRLAGVRRNAGHRAVLKKPVIS